MTNDAILAWIRSKPGPFEGTMMEIWCQAYADFYGKDIGGFDLGFMGTVEGCGYTLKPIAPRRWILKLN